MRTLLSGWSAQGLGTVGVWRLLSDFLLALASQSDYGNWLIS